jgi:hypothetical protein
MHSCRQRTPSPFEAVGLFDSHWRIRPVRRNARALVEIGLQTLGSHRSIRQQTRRQHRERQAAPWTEIKLDGFFLLPIGRRITLVASMQVNLPVAAAGTYRPFSIE